MARVLMHSVQAGYGRNTLRMLVRCHSHELQRIASIADAVLVAQTTQQEAEHVINIAKAQKAGFDTTALTAELPAPKAAPRHSEHYSDRVRALVDRGITHSNHWIVLDGAPRNCKEVLEGWALQEEREQSAKDAKTTKEKEARRELKRTVRKALTPGTDLQKLSGNVLKALLKYFMKEGHSKHTAKTDIIQKIEEQWHYVSDSDSD